jgi:zinc transport system permease protein
MLDFFQYGFMLRALGAGSLIAIIAPTIGMFLVMRRYAFLADTLAHVSLAGVAIAALAGLNPILTALFFSIGAAFSSETLRRHGRVAGEGTLVLFLSGGLALSAVLLGFSRGGINIQSILFGSILTVTQADVWMIAALGTTVFVIILLLFKELFASAFDEELALTGGIPARAINMLLVILAAVTVSISMRIVGVLLVGALMVIPVLGAMQWRQTFFRTWILSMCISLLSVIIGLVLCYELGLASGGTIVLTAIGFFMISWAKQHLRR